MEVARHPNNAAQNPNILKLSSVTDVSIIPPTMGTKEAHIRQSKYFLHTSHCKTTIQIHRGKVPLQITHMKVTRMKGNEKIIYYSKF